MSDASNHNIASSSQPVTSNQMTGGGSGNAAAVAASSNVSSMANTAPSTNLGANPTAATSFTTTSTIPTNPSSGTTSNSTNTTTNISGSNIAVPISSTMAQRETSINSNTNTTTTTTTMTAAATASTTTTNPSGNVTTATSVTTNRVVPTVKKQKKRIKDTSTGKETNDSSGNPVKKKVRKVNRNSSGGTGPNSTGRQPGTSSTGTNVTTSNTGGGGGITNHHNHPNMPSIHHNGLIVHDGLSPAQQAAQEQMRRALEEDQYSLVGSIIDHNNDSDNNYDDDTTDDGDRPYTNYTYNYRGSAVRLDKAAMIQAVRKYILLEQRLQQQQQQQNTNGTTLMSNGIMEDHGNIDDDDDDDEMYGMEDDDDEVGYGSNPGDARRGGVASHTGSSTNHNHRTTSNGNNKKKKRKDELTQLQDDVKSQNQQPMVSKDPLSLDPDDDLDRDGGSIFGATTGQSNSTWVECDKCKKWRRLRGVVDEKKLPSKWYCSMNKNDPERARCSAPEEEYETSHTPESAADSRTRKHLRVWVRRLQCNEAYESRQPTLTRGKKRNAVSSSSTNPYEWVRCCNPSCGKWRALLRIMDAKGNVVDRTNDGEWYCVMNNWDEKMASCAAPQENIPAVGCPPWVMQDGK